MAFKKPPAQPEFASLKTTLAQVSSKDNAMYQTLQLLIERLMQMQGIFVDDVSDINNSINTINSIVNIVADKKRTYITVDDESLYLPNSRQLLAGTNITFDDTVANKRTINATGGGTGTDHVPMNVGGEPLTFLSDGDGSSILIEYTPGT